MIGQKLLHYEITEKLGEGGMGVVYKARDSKLGRTVALKVLPENFAEDAARMERFQREARTLASLNHRNIAAIYGLEESDGVRAIVMELVDGETLARRISRGALPMRETLEYAEQVAEALQAAHEKGIVHRDLKPANIVVTSEGQVKVLDFGLAKAIKGEYESDPEHSPTLTIGPTRAGVILGTAAYMAPEQAKGKRADRRADIWAFGVVLYEMLTGRRAFEGETAAEILARVLEREPDWTLLPGETPEALRRLLIHCLSKDLKTRLHDIADAGLVVADLLKASPSVMPAPKPANRWKRPLQLALAGAALAGLLLLAWWGGRQAGAGEKAGQAAGGITTDTEISLAGSPALALDGQASIYGYDPPLLDISPDGRRLVYVAMSEDGVTRLFLREMRAPGVRVIPGTEGAVHPFFSPDGEWVGFLTNHQVRKVPVSGGSASNLCAAKLGTVATWASDGNIYFNEIDNWELSRVSAAGGDPVRVSSAKPGVSYGRVLPDGKSVFVTLRSRSISGDHAEIRLMDLATKTMHKLVPGGYDARYAPPGYLVFSRGGELYAVEFDLERREVRGQPTRIVSGVRMDPLFLHAQAVVSGRGILAYVPGGDAARGKLAWVDRQGRTEFLPLEERVWGAMNLSPDGRRLAIQVPDVTDYIQIYDFVRGSGEKIGGSVRSQQALWSPDSKSLATLRGTPESGQSLVVYQPGSGQPAVLLESRNLGYIKSWSPDGRQILITTDKDGVIRPQLLQVSPGGVLSETHLAKTQLGYGAFVLFSPNGRWAISYYGGEIRVFSLYGDQSYQIATGLGTEPLWCSQCDELFYRQGSKWFAVRVRFEPEFQFDPPRLVFQTTGFIDTWGYSYAVSPDGQRILVVKRTKELPRDRIHVIQNWTGLLRQ